MEMSTLCMEPVEEIERKKEEIIKNGGHSISIANGSEKKNIRPNFQLTELNSDSHLIPTK